MQLFLTANFVINLSSVSLNFFVIAGGYTACNNKKIQSLPFQFSFFVVDSVEG